MSRSTRLSAILVALTVLGWGAVARAEVPYPGLRVHYDQAVAVFEKSTGEPPCTVYESLLLVFYVPTYQQLGAAGEQIAPIGRPSPPLPFVTGEYARTDPCVGTASAASGEVFLDSSQYSFDSMTDASLVGVELPLYEAGDLIDIVVLNLTWSATGSPSSAVDPASDGEHEAGVYRSAQIEGTAQGTEVAFTEQDATYAEIGRWNRVTAPLP